MAVDATLIGILDHIAAGREAAAAAWSTGDDLWTRVDAAGDETFENRVKGSTTTTADTVLQQGGKWNQTDLQQFISLLASYYSTDLGLASPYWDSYLSGKWSNAAYNSGWRVPYWAAEAIAEALGASNRLDQPWVFPKGTRPADEATPSGSGMHRLGYLTGTVGSPTYTSDAGAIDTDIMIGVGIVAINLETSPGPSSLTLTCTLQDETTKDIALGDAAFTAQYKQVIVGVGAVGGGGAAADQADVLIKTSVAQFKAGEWVLLYQDDDVQEVVQIASIDTLTLTMETDLRNSYDEDDLVIPMFTDVTWKSGTMTDGKHIDLYAFPDRIIAL